ncbi:39S ribosomal protein L18, mitochondrial isoform X1 [Leucoraja erinacea]|uniref:39S ribosomal protein L18, mitochondrial isoform X1 n=1 Tax=Leucoraja erinaceus TaxID=7782 RepID=UPI002453D572|nr:39S ribosomal protein L18, mitochondrial isoform X1 [Leucoraja erinacea]
MAVAAARTGLARAGAPGSRRLASCPQVSPQIDREGNGTVSPRFLNRNPRNLERLALASRDKGWCGVWPGRDFWHRFWPHSAAPGSSWWSSHLQLSVRRTQHHIDAFVESAEGKVVISASTKEWAIKKHLHATRGPTAARNLALVLSHRCLEAGLGLVHFRCLPWEFRSETIQLFREALKDSGLVLSEPRCVFQRTEGGGEK